MKKWKPTKAWAKKAKKATKELITCYEKSIEPDACPYSSLYEYHNEGCPKCPWVVFNGATCLEFDFGDTPIKKRLPRLRGWVRKFDNIIAGGSK